MTNTVINTPVPATTPQPEEPEILENTITIPLPGLPKSAIPLEMVLIPAGEFVMGSSPEEAGHQDNESPLHTVKIPNPFYIGKFEVNSGNNGKP